MDKLISDHKDTSLLNNDRDDHQRARERTEIIYRIPQKYNNELIKFITNKDSSFYAFSEAVLHIDMYLNEKIKLRIVKRVDGSKKYYTINKNISKRHKINTTYGEIIKNVFTIDSSNLDSYLSLLDKIPDKCNYKLIYNMQSKIYPLHGFKLEFANTFNIYQLSTQDSGLYLTKQYLSMEERFIVACRTLTNVSIIVNDDIDMQEFFLCLYPNSTYNYDVFYINRHLQKYKIDWITDTYGQYTCQQGTILQQNIIPGIWVFILSTSNGNHFIYNECGNVDYINKGLYGFNSDIISCIIRCKVSGDDYYSYDVFCKTAEIYSNVLESLKTKISIKAVKKHMIKDLNEIHSYAMQYKNIYVRNGSDWKVFCSESSEISLLVLSSLPGINNIVLRDNYVLLHSGYSEFTSNKISKYDERKLMVHHKIYGKYGILRTSDNDDNISLQRGMLLYDGVVCKFMYKNGVLKLICAKKYQSEPDHVSIIRFKMEYNNPSWILEGNNNVSISNYVPESKESGILYIHLRDKKLEAFNIFCDAKYVKSILDRNEPSIVINLSKLISIYTFSAELIEYKKKYKNINILQVTSAKTFDAPECDLIVIGNTDEKILEKIAINSSMDARVIGANTAIIDRYFINGIKRVTYFGDKIHDNKRYTNRLQLENPHIGILKYEKYTRSKLEEVMLSKNIPIIGDMNHNCESKINGELLVYIEFITLVLKSKRKPVSITTLGIVLDNISIANTDVLKQLFAGVKCWYTTTDDIKTESIENLLYISSRCDITYENSNIKYSRSLVKIGNKSKIMPKCISYKYYTIPFGDSAYVSISYHIVPDKNEVRPITNTDLFFKNYNEYYSQCIFKYKLPFGYEHIFDNCYHCHTVDAIITKYTQYSDKTVTYAKVYNMVQG
jgi:hypothetical protein